jgi:single-strand DNA-binding protein
LGRGDLVHIVGRVRQTQYEREGQTVYSVDLIADGFATLSQHGDPADFGRDD